MANPICRAVFGLVARLCWSKAAASRRTPKVLVVTSNERLCGCFVDQSLQ